MTFQNKIYSQTAKHKRSRWGIFRGITDVVLIIVTLSLAIYLAEIKKDCRDGFFRGTTGCIVTTMVITSFFKVAVTLMRFSRSAQRHLSKSKFFFCKAILSVGYCSSMLPWILIDTDCDAINLIYQEKYRWVIAQQIAIIVLASLLIIGISSFFIMSKRRSILLASLKRYEHILWKVSGVLAKLSLVICVHTTVVILASLKDPVPLVIVELFGLLFNLTVSVYYRIKREPAT